MPNEPHADDSSAIKHTDASSKDTPAPRDAKRSTVKRATTYLKHAGNTPHPRSPLASLMHFCMRNTEDHPSRGFCPRKQSLGTCKTDGSLSHARGQRPPTEITIGIPHAFLHEEHSGSPKQGILPAQAIVRDVKNGWCPILRTRATPPIRDHHWHPSRISARGTLRITRAGDSARASNR